MNERRSREGKKLRKGVVSRDAWVMAHPEGSSRASITPQTVSFLEAKKPGFWTPQPVNPDLTPRGMIRWGGR